MGRLFQLGQKTSPNTHPFFYFLLFYFFLDSSSWSFHGEESAANQEIPTFVRVNLCRLHSYAALIGMVLSFSPPVSYIWITDNLSFKCFKLNVNRSNQIQALVIKQRTDLLSNMFLLYHSIAVFSNLVGQNVLINFLSLTVSLIVVSQITGLC